MSFANSNPPASASNSIFNIFSKPGSKSSSSSSAPSTDPSSASSASKVSPISSWFPEEVKKTYTTSDSELSSSSSDSSDSDSNSTSFMGYLVRFILVVVLLGFAGFNVFKEMGLITDDVLDFIKPFMEWSTGILGSVSKQFVSTTSEGTRTGIDIVSGAAKSGVNVIDDQVTGKGGLTNVDDASIIPSSGGGTAKQEAARARALTMKTGSQLNYDIPAPAPDDSLSVTQKGKTSGKAGYCFVGEDRGNRSCVYVNESDTCMSGNIFPSKDKCINPNLRV